MTDEGDAVNQIALLQDENEEGKVYSRAPTTDGEKDSKRRKLTVENTTDEGGSGSFGSTEVNKTWELSGKQGMSLPDLNAIEVVAPNPVMMKQYTIVRENRRYLQTLRRTLAMVRLASGRSHPYGWAEKDPNSTENKVTYTYKYFHKRIKDPDELRLYFNESEQFKRDYEDYLQLVEQKAKENLNQEKMNLTTAMEKVKAKLTELGEKSTETN